MTTHRLPVLVAGLLALAFQSAVAEEIPGAREIGQPNPEYLRDRKELEDMLKQGPERPRDFELFEVACEPLELNRIVIPDRTGHEQVFNYLTFRIRNQVVDSTQSLQLRAKGYNEVLKSITEQYEMAKINSEGGVRLQVEGAAGGAVADGVILEREEAKPKTRSVNISAIAHDENGTRLGLLDDPVASGPQYQYSFPDLGEASRTTVQRYVRDRIEEQVQHKLMTIDEIRKLTLEPFDGIKRVEVADLESPDRDRNGWFVGEAYGVIIFDRLSDYGQQWTIEIRGLCNKFRIRTPVGEAGKPENYLQSKVMRRTYVVHARYSGDEYFRDQDSYVIAAHGWEWVPSFQRLVQRRNVAYAKFILDGIMDEQGERRPDFEKTEAWSYYSEVRGQFPAQAADGYGKTDRLPDLEKSLEAR